MVTDKPSREEDNKVVMSKISRDEFANLQKLCEMEKKSVNKKLREIIQKEIAEIFFREKPLRLKGERKKFFIPSENRFIEMLEVEDDN
ncbi:hypothetical protein HN630_04640 [archaeon]|jgi:hypothetical protein|nr:hypothetical protein [archaeon]MBT7568167.1 hypothetical protein [archaeon]